MNINRSNNAILIKCIYRLRFSTSSMVSGRATPLISGNIVTNPLYSTDITPETDAAFYYEAGKKDILNW